MKRAVILHGLQGTSSSNWFPWLKTQLEQQGYEVWVPDLPGADHPVGSKWVFHLMKSSWDFNQSLVIGHSAGAVAALYLAQTLPDPIRLRAVVPVSAFWPIQMGSELFAELKDLHDTAFDFAKMKAHCDNFVFIHSDNDPYCPLQGAQQLAQQTDGSIHIVPGGGHFSLSSSPSYTQLPVVLDELQKHRLL